MESSATSQAILEDFVPFEDDMEIEEEDGEGRGKGGGGEEEEEEEGGGGKDLQAKSSVTRPEQPEKKQLAPVTAVLRYNAPWVNQRRKHSTVPIEFLHQEIIDFANYVSPTEEERFARSEAIQRLEKVVHGVWEDTQVQGFGSFDSHLFLPTSDLDLVILNEAWSDEEQIKTALNKLAKAIIKSGLALPDTIQTITKARIPIIKYRDGQTDFEVDVSFNITSGLEAATFMRKEMASQLAIRPLTLVLKCFLDGRALNEVFHGGLGSYSIMCLVISFLQMHPLVQTGLIRAHENLGVLLMEMFELYGKNFNNEVVGIDVRQGGSYFSKRDWDWLQEAKPQLLSIVDPQNDENDIAKGSFAYGAVRAAFEHAFNVLKCAMMEFDQVQRQQRSDRKETKNETTNVIPSILGSIVTLDPKVLRHRFYIQQTTNL